MPLPAAIVAALPEVHDACRRSGARALWVFGSAATGGWNPQSSDIDLLVEMPPTLPDLAERFLQLYRDLSGIFGRPVELVSLDGVRNPHFRAELESTRLSLYAAA